MIELHRADELIAHLDAGRATVGIVLQGIDLSDHAAIIEAHSWAGATFLGCDLGPASVRHVTATGGTWFPAFEGLPFDPYRSGLYTQDELDRVDDAIYRHTVVVGRHPSVLEALAQRIHDHAIDDALSELLAQNDRVVAIMGGHRLGRDDPVYRDVAHIGRSLTRAGYLLATGGGPGAMEAANLGAWLAPADDEALPQAIETLGRAPGYHDEGHRDLAQQVVDAHPDGAPSLAIPTWFYGHEPTNAFAPKIAKYFSNSIREDGLLAIATHGVVYTPGSAGTVQEIFMDATQNHYTTFKVISPMVLYGHQYWSDTLPAHRLLMALAKDRPYEQIITLTDDPDEAVRFLIDHPPTTPRP